MTSEDHNIREASFLLYDDIVKKAAETHAFTSWNEVKRLIINELGIHFHYYHYYHYYHY